jgi:hypothetical protein
MRLEFLAGLYGDCFFIPFQIAFSVDSIVKFGVVLYPECVYAKEQYEEQMK